MCDRLPRRLFKVGKLKKVTKTILFFSILGVLSSISGCGKNADQKSVTSAEIQTDEFFGEFPINCSSSQYVIFSEPDIELFIITDTADGVTIQYSKPGDAEFALCSLGSSRSGVEKIEDYTVKYSILDKMLYIYRNKPYDVPVTTQIHYGIAEQEFYDLMRKW